MKQKELWWFIKGVLKTTHVHTPKPNLINFHSICTVRDWLGEFLVAQSHQDLELVEAT